MIDFSDKPYVHFPPRYSVPLAWLIRLVNRRHYLPHKHRIVSLEVTGTQAVRQARQQGHRLLLLPNHPTHSDASIFMEAARQAGVVPQIMAAYDVFLRSRMDRFVMQRLGAFSVDREGSDSRAMKQAAATLDDPRFALTIFPEGNVYLANDVVTPFHEGAAFMALRAAKEWPTTQKLLAVPVSIKATYCEDVRDAMLTQLRALAKAIECDVDDTLSPVQIIHRVGLTGLQRNLRHRGIDVNPNDDLATLIGHAGGAVLAQVERKLGLAAGEKLTVIDRVRAVRRRIHEVRIDPERIADHAAAATWADEAMLAFRIASYTGTYLAKQPTIDRVGETIEKLCEDGYNRAMKPIGDRCAFVHFGDPIDVRGYLGEGKLRDAVRRLTADCEGAVQRGIDAINAHQPARGRAAVVLGSLR